MDSSLQLGAAWPKRDADEEEEKTNALDARSLSALVHLKGTLSDIICIGNIIDHLKPVVSPQQYETLSLDSKTNHQKVQCLIDILSNGTQEQFNKFVSVLRACGSEDIADSLDSYEFQADKQWSRTIVREVLVKGEVPFFEKVIDRPEKLSLIRSALRSVQSQQLHSLRVVVVHGMGGSGKSVLASEAIRCASIIAECFPNGVIWKSAGHMRELEGTDLEGKIHELVRETLHQLGWKQQKQKPEAMTLRELGTEMVGMTIKKQLLIVLDDVWQQPVLEALKSVPVCLLVTSRNKAIADSLRAHKEYVEAMKCTQQEARDIVRSHCGLVDEEALKTVLTRCDGLPLALSQMASIIKDKPAQQQREILKDTNNDEWLLKPFKFVPTSTTTAATNDHCYYYSLGEALEVSLIQLGKEIQAKSVMGKRVRLSGIELRDFYLDIAAIDDDEELFASKLHPVWNQNIEPTQTLLEDLADRNLLTRTGRKHKQEDIFTIHDVIVHLSYTLPKSILFNSS